MTTKYNVKPEYSKVPSVRITENLFLIRLLNYFMISTRWFFRWDKRVGVRTYRITGRHGNTIKIIRVQPKAMRSKKSSSLLYYHGGAFCLSYAGLHLKRAQEYALASNARIFIVDYRLSYKHPFPAALDDCYDALEWMHGNSVMLGIDRKNVVVGGDSAGGALAAAVAQKARDTSRLQIKAQVLIYPVLDASCSSRSATEFTDTPLFAAADNQVMWRIYLRAWEYVTGKNKFRAPHYASPMHASDFKNLPPAYIESAEFDPLCDEARTYAEKLKAAGVQVHLLETKGTIHGYDFYEKSETTKKYYEERVAQIVLYLKK